MAPERPEYKYWGKEWDTNPKFNYVPNEAIPAKERVAYVCQNSKSWRDFFLWGYYDLYKRAPYIGVYYDDGEVSCTNTHHGCGYIRNGQVVPEWSYMGKREINKRMYTMIRSLEGRSQFIQHRSGMPNMAFFSFVDIIADGENFTGQLTKDTPDYHTIFPPDAFRATSMGHNFGPAVWFLDQFSRSGAVKDEDWKTLTYQPVEHLFGLILLHDSTYWYAYAPLEAYEPMVMALRKYNWGDDYRMIPYWRQTVTKKLPEKMYATFYVDDRRGRAIMIFLNNNEEGGTMTLDVNWGKLGFDGPGNVIVTDAVHNGPCSIEAGKLEFTYGRANFRMVVFERK
jgi:hypothetical protein